MTWFDPHLIKVGVVGVMFVGRMVIAANKKRNASNRSIRPPQSAAGPSPIAPMGGLNSQSNAARSMKPTSTQKPTRDQQPMRNSPATAQPQEPGSPWSSTNGPFDS